MSDEEQIRQLVKDWLAATEKGDIETILRLMDDNVRFLLPGQPAMDKHDFTHTQRAAAQFDINIDYDIQEIHVSGSLAYCWNHLSVEIRLPGQGSVRRTGHALSVLAKKNGCWVILRDANMLTEQPER